MRVGALALSGVRYGPAGCAGTDASESGNGRAGEFSPVSRLGVNTQLTKSDFSYSGDSAQVGELRVTVTTERDDDPSAPWEECDGHGPVSEWRSKDSKRPGERVLCSDGRGRMVRFYDWQAAIAEAKRDGWDAKPYKTGTKGQQAERAVAADFEFLRGWCADEWQYVVLIVRLVGADGVEISRDVLGGVESYGEYWREQAAEMANALVAAYAVETGEREHWEARDVVTVAS